MYLWSVPEREAGSYCYDHFAYNDLSPEDYWGLAYEEDAVDASQAIMMHLANKLPRGVNAEVCYTDGTDQVVLLIESKAWRRKDVQAAWAQVIATPLEKLVAEADLGNDLEVIERVSQSWDGDSIAGRVHHMIYLRNAGHIETDDLTAAILDDVPGWVVQGIIAHQTEHMLRG
jgi:hypothetical protein